MWKYCVFRVGKWHEGVLTYLCRTVGIFNCLSIIIQKDLYYNSSVLIYIYIYIYDVDINHIYIYIYIDLPNFVNVTMFVTCNYYVSTNATCIYACVWYNRTKLCYTCPALTDTSQTLRSPKPQKHPCTHVTQVTQPFFLLVCYPDRNWTVPIVSAYYILYTVLWLYY